MSTTRPVSSAKSLPKFESLEPRTLLSDTQIGTVTMPYTGYLSAGVYDSNGNIVRSLLELSPQSAGNVNLMWDGRDDQGRMVQQEGVYTWRAVASQVNLLDQGSVGDSLFTDPPTLYQDGGWFEAGELVAAVAVNSVGGMAGMAGGTLAASQTDTFYADTSIATYSLSGTITASGTFDVLNITTGWDEASPYAGFFIGHFSENATAGHSEFIGLEFQNYNVPPANPNSVLVRARFQLPGTGGANSDWVVISTSPTHTFSYTYSPSGGAYGHGQLSVTIDNGTPLVASLSDGEHNSGAQFDAFGLGYTSNLNGQTDSSKTAKAYIDDVQYSGHSGTESFTSSPAGWTGSNNSSNGNDFGFRQFDKDDGSVYQISDWEEGTTLNRFGQDGTPIWHQGGGMGTTLAVDNTYVYAAWRTPDNYAVIHRYYARDGLNAPFPAGAGVDANGDIIVHAGGYDTRSAGHQDWTPEEERLRGNWGVVSDGLRLFVSDAHLGKVMIFNTQTGAKLDEFTFTSPQGIAVQTSDATTSTIWVAYNNDRVTKYTYNSTNHTLTAGTSIVGLNQPQGLSIGRNDGHLFIAEMNTANIKEYDISSTPVLAGLQTFGSRHYGGAITDSQFYFPIWASIAVDKDGILNVNDYRRVQRFYTEGGSAGTLYQSWQAQWAGAPSNIYSAPTQGRHYVLDQGYEYEVDPEYTGGPRAGWLGDGTYRLNARYYYERSGVCGAGTTLRRTLLDGQTPKDFMFVLEEGAGGNKNVVAYTILPDGSTKLTAIIAGEWIGADRMGYLQGGQYTWSDTDGDGAIDWNGVGSGIDGEVKWFVPKGQSPQLSDGEPWVDYAGNVYMTNATSDLIKVAPAFVNGVLTYDWSNAAIVAPYVADSIAIRPDNIRVASNGDIYATGIGLNYTTYLVRYDSSGNRKMMVYSPSTEENWAVMSLAFDETNPNPGYFYTASMWQVYMYTSDGLAVAHSSQAANPMGGVDYLWGLGAYTEPSTGKTYVYAEENFIGRDVRFRVDNIASINRQEGSFTYTAPVDLKGRWQFETNASDTLGLHNGTIYGGASLVAGGKIGNAIDLDGLDDYVVIPYASYEVYDRPMGLDAYTISAWIKPTDVTGVNVLNLSDGLGNYSGAIRINNSGKFEHYTSDGTGHFVTGTTTALTNTWYHVAIVASDQGMMRLYVNGVEEGTAQSVGWMWAFSSQIDIGKAGALLGSFDGLIDDVRMYETGLGQNEIYSLFSLTTPPSVTVTATDSAAAEASPNTGTYSISRSSSTGDLLVKYTVTGGTSPTDFTTPLSGSVLILNGQTSVTITVTPVDDVLAEVSERATLTITPRNNYTVGSPASAYVDIADNDSTNPTVTVTKLDDASESGPDTGTFRISRTNSTGDLVVKYTIGGTAVGAFDYSALSGSVVIPNGATSTTVIVTPINDSYYESSETAILTISANSLYTVGSPSNATMNIASNDETGLPTVTLTANDTTATESPVTTGSFLVTRTGATTSALTVNYTVGGTATSGSDFTAIGTSVVIPIGSLSTTVTLTPVNDTDVEGDETVIVTLAAGSYTNGSPNTGTVTITSEDVSGGGVQDFTSAPSWTGSGNNGSGNAYGYSGSTSYAGGSTGEVGGQFAQHTTASYYADTNLNGAGASFHLTDAITASGKFTVFGQNSMNGEWFLGHLSSGVGDRSAVGIEFLEQDATHVRFRAKVQGHSGADVISSTYVLPNGDYSFTYSYSSTGGANNQGYLTVHIWGNGEDQTKTVDLTATVRTETATFNGFGVGILSGVSGGDDAATNVKMYIDDVDYTGRVAVSLPTVTLSANDTTATESPVTTGSFLVTRTGATTSALTVNYTVGGTAASGSDFNAIGTSVVIPIGSLSTTVTLTPVNDTDVESDETVIVNLAAGSYTNGASTSGTVTITSEDVGLPTVNLSLTDGTASESPTTSGSFLVSRTGATTNPLTVNYTVGGNATSGSDYTSIGTSVVIPAGSSSVAVVVNPVNDTDVESDETVTLTLASGSYTNGTAGPYTVTITSEDVALPTVNLSLTDGTASESPLTSGSFLVSRTGATTNPLTVNYTVGGSATSVSDYTSIGTSVVIPAGSSSVAVVVNPVNDTDVESDETVTLTLASGSYTNGTAGPYTVKITSEDTSSGVSFATNPNWTGYNNNNPVINNVYGWSSGTNYAGGTTGEIGGMFTRRRQDSYYGDTNLSHTFSLSESISASGKFNPLNLNGWSTGGDSSMFIGHFSQISGSQEFIGLEIQDGPDSTHVRVNARFQLPGGGGAVSDTLLLSLNGTHTFSYVYNPNSGSYGQLSLLIDGVLVTTGGQSVPVSLNSTERNSGAQFDAFGMGVTSIANTDDTVYYVSVYADDLIYDGYQASPPATTVTAGTLDTTVAEQGADVGTYKIIRTGTTGNLRVNYTMTGTASADNDYVKPAGFAVIPNGQTSVLVTLTPVDDYDLVDANETAILNITADAAHFTLGSPSTATLTITDNDVAATRAWTFNNTLASVPTGVTATITGTTAYDSAGRLGAALSLNGSSHATMVLDGNPTSYTVSLWVKPTGTITSKDIIVNTATTSGTAAAQYQLRINSAGKFEHWVNVSGGKTVTGTTTAVAGTWYHVTIVAANSGYARLYVNGVEEGTAQAITTLPTTGTRWQIGNATTGGGSFAKLAGSVDDVHIYNNNALSATQVANMAMVLRDGFESGTTATGGNGWGGAWTFSGGASVVTTGAPQSGTNHLQLTGSGATATRAANLAGATGARLTFAWKANSFENSESAYVDLWNGSAWVTVKTINNGDDDNAYHAESIDLPAWALISTFQVRFRSLMSAADDYFYVDNLLISR